MNYVSLLRVYNFTKSSTMWIYVLSFIVLIIILSIVISIAKKNFGWFGATLALAIPFLFIGIMGFRHPLPGTFYTENEKAVVSSLFMTYNNMEGAYKSDNLIFYKSQTYNIICMERYDCYSKEVAKIAKMYIDVDEMIIDLIKELQEKVKKNSTITIVKDQKRLMATYNEDTHETIFEIDLREHYFDKDKKEKDEAVDSLEIVVDEEFPPEYCKVIVEVLFVKTFDNFEIIKDGDTIKYTLKAD